MARNYNSFSAIIENYFSRNGGWLRLKGELAVYYWPKIAGIELAKKVEAVRFQAGFLYLQTENPALAHQLLMMKLEILKKYQSLLGAKTVKGIKVKVGTIKEIKAKEEKDFILELNQAEETTIKNCSQEIIDPEIAEKFKHFMEKSFLQHKQKKAMGGHACFSCGVIIDSGFTYCPCCEMKVNEEINAYFQYKRKSNQEITRDDLNKLDGLSHLRLNKP